MSYSILRDKPAPRPLPIALAHYVARQRIGADEHCLRIANRIYLTLAPRAKLEFKDELHACKAARRGQCEARIA